MIHRSSSFQSTTLPNMSRRLFFMQIISLLLSHGLARHDASALNHFQITRRGSLRWQATVQGLSLSPTSKARQSRQSRLSKGKSPITTIESLTTLNFWEHMICGATSQSLAKTIFHPANVAKTILQTSSSVAFSDRGNVAVTRLQPVVTMWSLLRQPRILWRGTAAQFGLSAIQGAVTFAIVEETRHVMGNLWQRHRKHQYHSKNVITSRTTEAGLDFASSVVSTLVTSIVSVPQMVLMDNLMAGNYPNLPTAVSTLYKAQGIGGFYRNWGPHLIGKIPSYALTWVFFQHLQRTHHRWYPNRIPSAVENTCMGFLASAASVCLMMPVEVVKTRMVAGNVPYRSMTDGFIRVVTDEGWPTLYRGLVPRLVSTVPMTGVNFGIYETLKRFYLETKIKTILGH